MRLKLRPSLYVDKQLRWRDELYFFFRDDFVSFWTSPHLCHRTGYSHNPKDLLLVPGGLHCRMDQWLGQLGFRLSAVQPHRFAYLPAMQGSHNLRVHYRSEGTRKVAEVGRGTQKIGRVISKNSVSIEIKS
jgi:hypothetical protein